MDTLFRMRAEEINESLIDFLRASFKRKKIAVHIYEDEQMDETEYILSDPIEREEILQSIKDVNDNVGLKIYTMDKLKQEFLKEPKP